MTSDPLLIEDWVLPGTRLGHVDDFVAGHGTYTRKDYVYAAVVGQRCTITTQDKPVLEVSRKKEPMIVPGIGKMVTARVIRVNPRLATLDILCVGDRALKETYRAIIRRQDVRATEIDKVEIYKSFRPGDIVRAEVISLGDAKRYFLSTAKNEYGVIYATSGVSGRTLIPVNWEQMQCPLTKSTEYRKVAKIDTLPPK